MLLASLEAVVILLGSTGSIGQNTLKVAKAFDIQVEALVAGKNIALLNQQIELFNPKFVVIADIQDAHKLQSKNAKVFYGEKGILEVLHLSQSSLVVNALVGFVGLAPSLCAISLQKTLALANKESLVNAGWLMDTSRIIPLDSEHFSLWHLLQNRPFQALYLTASGGALRDVPLSKLHLQTAQEALKHPNWKMGSKITIDSASMVNKLFEVLEARWLFDSVNIDAFLERKSIIHALVAFSDGSISTHLASPDMKLAISYALNANLAKTQAMIPKLTFEDFASLNLEPICPQRYELWQLKPLLLQNPKLGILLNASNEIAVEYFLKDYFSFGKISKIIQECFEYFHTLPPLESLEEIQDFDLQVRAFATSLIQGL